MIKNYNNVPFFIKQTDTLDLSSIHNLIKFVNPHIMKAYPYDKGYNQDDLTGRHLYYNIFSIRQPCLYDLYKFMVECIKEYLIETNIQYNNLYMQAWANLTEKNQKIIQHKHHAFLNGHIAINAEPSLTTYIMSENIDITNKNGQFCIVNADLTHFTSVWEENEPRTTIAFEVVKDVLPSNEIALGNFYPI